MHHRRMQLQCLARALECRRSLLASADVDFVESGAGEVVRRGAGDTYHGGVDRDRSAVIGVGVGEVVDAVAEVGDGE